MEQTAEQMAVRKLRLDRGPHRPIVFAHVCGHGPVRNLLLQKGENLPVSFRVAGVHERACHEANLKGENA